MTEKQRLDAIRSDNAHLCRKLTALLGEKVSLRHHVHFTTKQDVWYVQIEGTAYSGYQEADGINLILKGLERVAGHASARAAKQTAEHYHDQYYRNPHAAPRDIQPMPQH